MIYTFFFIITIQIYFIFRSKYAAQCKKRKTETRLTSLLEKTRKKKLKDDTTTVNKRARKVHFKWKCYLACS